MRPFARNTDFGVPTRSDTNQAVQPQEMVRCQEIHIYKVEGLYYLHVCTCSKNKSADQLWGNRAANLHLCLCIGNKGFLTTWLIL